MPRAQVKGTSVQDFAKRLRKLPRTVAQDVAQKAAPMMTEETKGSFNAGQTVYGKARPPGVNGLLTLRKSGEIERALKFVNAGTRVRAVLGPKDKNGVQYGRFLIGRYEILPNGPIPLKWREKLDGFFKDAAERRLKGGS